MSTTEDQTVNKSNEGETQVYELGYLVLPSVPSEDLPTLVSNLRSIIEKAGASPLDSEDPFLESLAYSMSKTIGARKYVASEAYIGWMKFEAESRMIEGIKSSVDKIDEILRSLLIKAPRETTFTFEEAREARKAREEALNNPVEETSEEALEKDEDKPLDDSEAVVE